MKKSLLLKILAIVTAVSAMAFVGTACSEPEHVHSYTEVVTQPTCTEKGFTTFTCECGNSYTGAYVNAKGHTYVPVVTAPTCTEDGFTTHTCECGDSKVDSTVDKLGHDFKNYVYNNDATFAADGTQTATCEREGCNETDTIVKPGSKLQSAFAFKTLTVEETTVTGSVANAVETFDFANEINKVGLYTFKVFSDEQKTTEITDVNVNLVEGNNVFYIVSYLSEVEKDTYEVTIYRNVKYSVSFDVDGGSAIDPILVEEGTFATAPTAPTKVGYTFAGWVDGNDAPFVWETTAINGATTLYATWTARTDVAYVVEYYFENIENEEYTLNATATENKQGTTGVEVSADLKSFTGFTAPTEAVKGNVLADGSLVLKVYYTRKLYTVTFDGNGGTLQDGSESQTIKHGGNAIAPVYTKQGYNLAWDKDLTNISGETTITAVWNPAGGIAYVVKHYLENVDGTYPSEPKETENLTGTTEAEVSAAFKNYEHFNAPIEAVKGNVLADGSLVLEVKYTRKLYTVTFDGNGGTVQEGNEVQQVKYGASATAPTYTKVIGEVEYTFDGFDKEFNNIEGDINVTAKWVDNNKYVSYVYAGEEIIKKVAKVGGVYDIFATEQAILDKVAVLETEGYHVEWYIGEDKFTSLEFAEEPTENVTIEAKVIINTATLTIAIWGPEGSKTIGSINGEYSATLEVKHGDDLTKVVTIETYKGYEFVCFADTNWYDGVSGKPTASVNVNGNNIKVVENGANMTIYVFLYNYTIA